MPDDELTEDELTVIGKIRDRGFAVIVWTPEELGDAKPNKVEDRSIELGWDIIAMLGGPDSNDVGA